MDFLLELRCSTNYRSIEYAIDIDDEYVLRFHGGLMHLLDLGLLTYEAQLALYAGAAAVRAEFDDWAERVWSVGSWATESRRARLNALAPVTCDRRVRKWARFGERFRCGLLPDGLTG
jgi:hypothetical protein